MGRPNALKLHMRRKDLSDLFLLAAIWGGSFLFMRMAVGDLGPIVLSALRTLIAGSLLLPVLVWRKKLPLLFKSWRPIVIVGLLNAVLPFLFLSYATRTLPSGTMSIINAITPLWGGAIAWLWLKDRLPPLRIAGLAIGFIGIVVLVWDKLNFQATESILAVLAGVAGPFFYGIAANFTKKFLTGTEPIVIATGSLLAGGIVLLPFAVWAWPTGPVDPRAWAAMLMLAVLCTSVAYILYYRLLINIGPARAMTVTFLVPVFGVLWGWFWLHEAVTLRIVLGGAIILLGTALATGLLKPRVRR